MTGRRHTVVAGTILASLTLVTAACGSGGGRSATASPPASPSNPTSAAVGQSARHPLDPPTAGWLTTLVLASLSLRTGQLIPPRFAPGLSTTHGGFTTEDPGVSPDPDSHRLAALNLSLGYITFTSLSSWRPN